MPKIFVPKTGLKKIVSTSQIRTSRLPARNKEIFATKVQRREAFYFFILS
jgi:hypothetical protein